MCSQRTFMHSQLLDYQLLLLLWAQWVRSRETISEAWKKNKLSMFCFPWKLLMAHRCCSNVYLFHSIFVHLLIHIHIQNKYTIETSHTVVLYPAPLYFYRLKISPFVLCCSPFQTSTNPDSHNHIFSTNSLIYSLKSAILHACYSHHTYLSSSKPSSLMGCFVISMVISIVILFLSLGHFLHL